jgi:hypothetical protein
MGSRGSDGDGESPLPRLSNCGLDVARMDTSFRNPHSRHDIHGVARIDCHDQGMPKNKA